MFYEFAERRLGLDPFSHIPGIALELFSSIVRQFFLKMYEPHQDLGRGFGSRKTGLSPLVNALLTVPMRCSWCSSSPLNLDKVILRTCFKHYSFRSS